MDTQRLATTESEPRPVPSARPTGPRGRRRMPGPDAALSRGAVRDDRHRRPAPADMARVVAGPDSTADILP